MIVGFPSTQTSTLKWDLRFTTGNRFASMLFRPLLIAVLCCVVAFGHAPAWLHVATCHEATCAESSSHEVVRGVNTSGCHSCCGHANPFAGRSSEAGSSRQQDEPSSRVSASLQTPESSSSQPLEEHSSDGCMICQSLFSATGNVEMEGPGCAALRPFRFVPFESNEWVSEGVCHTLHLRGPPNC